MKRTIKLAVAAAVALTSTAAFATNGDHLIGTGAKARGMGGIGIGMSHGAESGLSNPALITTVKGTEVSFGGTVFMPDVETRLGTAGTFQKSASDLSVIPAVSVAQQVSDNLYWGIGMYGTAGMGVDYRGTTGGANMNFVSNLQLMQFALPVAYSVDGISVAIAPVVQYGALDINFNNGANRGTGVGQDLSLGYNIGASYTMGDLTAGAVYKSAIDMTYDQVITTAAAQFGLSAVLTDNLEQPAEYGLGLSYKMGGSTFAVDYKTIQWSSAKGYEQFGWDDQDVFMLGYEFDAGSWAARLGYNYAKSPIKELAAGATGTPINTLNLLGFPAIVESHYTVGGSYDFSKTTSLDVAYVYTPETSEFYNVGNANYQTETKHSQDAVSAQVNFKF